MCLCKPTCVLERKPQVEMNQIFFLSALVKTTMNGKGKDLKTQYDIVHVMKFKTKSANSQMTFKSHIFASSSS